MSYPKQSYGVGQGCSVLQSNRVADKTVAVKPDLPGNIIVIHGVNDVGTSYGAVEEGLCQGLDARMYNIARGAKGFFSPGTYRMPTAEDKERLEPDPDAVYFKRKMDGATHSPVIPFYWGFREEDPLAKSKNGQRTDRFGNRLDKDLSKGGGPFGNATSTLPDMWNSGLCSPLDVGGDPVRPLLSAPGRMYMVLAAKRLAALITMIHDYDPDETVSIVAHSQGCLISLLAQAFLLDSKDAKQRPADTLVLTHPPYSLVEDTTMFFSAIEGLRPFGGGDDEVMKGHYDTIADRQTTEARVKTLVNIVNGVVGKKHTTPPIQALTDQGKYCGMVGAKWSPAADRDNRGKVYLYFCPEDMTVALDNIQGIGWSGVPDYIGGTTLSETEKTEKKTSIWSNEVDVTWKTKFSQLQPFAELTKNKGFFQRVFTSKKRLDPAKKTSGPVLVGQAPHDFALRIEGEDEHAHVAESGRGHRSSNPEVAWPPEKSRLDFVKPASWLREGLRRINGEALPVPVVADLRGAGQIDPGSKEFPKNSVQAKLDRKDQGPCEEVDPIDSAIAITSGDGLNFWQEELPDPTGRKHPCSSPQILGLRELRMIQERYSYNQGKTNPDDQRRIMRATRLPDGTVRGDVRESPNEARKRWQHEVSPKSFHGAIIGSKENHRQVTAYDVAIGGGKAASDPLFYQYLCAVADWRLQYSKSTRPSILTWEKFIKTFSIYCNVEPAWRREIIEGNAKYYSTGLLPSCVPALHVGLPTSVVCETTGGKRTAVAATAEKKGHT